MRSFLSISHGNDNSDAGGDGYAMLPQSAEKPPLIYSFEDLRPITAEEVTTSFQEQIEVDRKDREKSDIVQEDELTCEFFGKDAARLYQERPYVPAATQRAAQQ